MLPLGLVRRAASRVLEGALAEGLEGLWRQVTVDELDYEPSEDALPS